MKANCFSEERFIIVRSVCLGGNGLVLTWTLLTLGLSLSARPLIQKIKNERFLFLVDHRHWLPQHNNNEAHWNAKAFLQLACNERLGVHYPHSLCFLVNTVDYFHSFISKVNNHLMGGLILLNWNICAVSAARALWDRWRHVGLRAGPRSNCREGLEALMSCSFIKVHWYFSLRLHV